MKLFATFGTAHLSNTGQSLSNRYLVVEGQDWPACRKAIEKIRGPIFAFDYPIEKLESQVEQFGLTEILAADCDQQRSGY